jgi:hypothetical protein
MTRLVVHAGTHATDWAAIQHQLVSWRQPLDRLGVRLHPADDAEAWLSGVYDVVDPTVSPPLADACRAAVDAGANLVLLSSENLEDSLRDPAQLANLAAFARDLEMALTVVVVVRDQLGYLNELYCDRITHLQMARDFPSFSADPSPGERFDYGAAYGPLIEAPDIDFIAVPYVELRPGAQAKPLLAASGLTVEDVTALPERGGSQTLPGPVVVAATRLLFKRLWRLGLLTSLPSPRLIHAAEALSEHGEEHAWDHGPHWGWDLSAREAAIAHYAPGNDVLARAVWGRPWGDAWESGEYVDVDLPARNPGLVVDVMATVDRIVKSLQAAKAAVVSD